MKAANFVPDMQDNVRNSVIDVLNARLTACLDFRLAVKQAHWNIKGPGFIAIHELLDQVAARMDAHIDVMAERVVQIGGFAHGTIQQFAEGTALKPYPKGIVKQEEHLQALRERLEALAADCRKAIDQTDEAGDANSADIMTGVSRALDKDLWFLAAHLEG
jgi:starvation-inducible DNA-binding protein